jgi:hypothetical protein
MRQVRIQIRKQIKATGVTPLDLRTPSGVELPY